MVSSADSSGVNRRREVYLVEEHWVRSYATWLRGSDHSDFLGSHHDCRSCANRAFGGNRLPVILRESPSDGSTRKVNSRT